MATTIKKGASIKIPGCPIVFYLPQPSISLTDYAAQTGQTERAVRQQADNNQLVLMKEKAGRERRVNMVYLLLSAYEEAQEALSQKVK